MAFDLDGFVKDLGLSGDEEAQVRGALGKPERVAVLEKNQLRQADFSRSQNDLKKVQDDLAAKAGRLDAELAEWASLSASEKTANTELRAAIEKSEQKVLALQQRVQRVAIDAGLDPAKALEGIDQELPKKEAPKVDPIDTSKFVDRDQFGKLSAYTLEFAADLPMLAQEHFDLMGERLNTRDLHAKMLARAGQKGANMDPRAIWEEEYGIAAKRAEKAAADRAAEREADRRAGYEQARTEAALPSAPSTGLHSPMLKTLDGKPHVSVLQRPAPETGVRSAAAALASGKYRKTA